MAKFCGKCGTKLDETTGLCPICTTEHRRQPIDSSKIQSPQTQIKNPHITIANKKITKFKGYRCKEHHEENGKKKSQSFGGKVCRAFLYILLLLVLVTGTICSLVYFGVVDSPEISYILARNGFIPQNKDISEPHFDNYVPNEEEIEFDRQKNLYYANNEIIVMFSDDATEEQKEGIISYLNGTLVGSIPETNMYQIKIGAKDSVEQLSDVADQLMAEFDYVIYATYDAAAPNAGAAYIPSDPWNGDVSQSDWEDDTIDGSNWWLEAVDAQYAWDYSEKFTKITIGISDGSFDTGHQDLKNKVSFANEVLKNRNIITPWWLDKDKFKDPKGRTVYAQDNFHGTHVAGIIGAEGNNKKGITGLVQNCNILLAPYYQSESREVYLAWDSSVYANLSYLVKAGAKVINYSSGKTNFLLEKKGHMGFSREELEREGNLAAISISSLIRSGYKDFIIVQSAGNGTYDTKRAVDAIHNGWFASVTDSSMTGYEDISIDEIREHIIIVGAAEQTSDGFQCTSFSNYGNQVNICAPGVNVFSTVPGEAFFYEFWGGYGYADGSSVAAPIVTGVCALTWSANPELTAGMVKEIVCTSTNTYVYANPESDSDKSYSLVNAKLSVETALNYSLSNDEDEQPLEFEQPNAPSETEQTDQFPESEQSDKPEGTDYLPDAAEISDQSICEALTEASIFSWDWFWDSSRDVVDEHDTYTQMTEDGMYSWNYKRVKYEGIHSVEDVVELTKHYYTEDVAEELVNQKQWHNIGDKLYMSEPDGIGGYAPDYYDVVIRKDSETQYTITVWSYFFGELEQEPFDIHYMFVDGYWVFDDVLCQLGLEVPINIINNENQTVDPSLYYGVWSNYDTASSIAEKLEVTFESGDVIGQMSARISVREYAIGTYFLDEDGSFSCSLIIDSMYNNLTGKWEPAYSKATLRGRLTDEDSMECELQYEWNNDSSVYHLKRTG